MMQCPFNIPTSISAPWPPHLLTPAGPLFPGTPQWALAASSGHLLFTLPRRTISRGDTELVPVQLFRSPTLDELSPSSSNYDSKLDEHGVGDGWIG